LKPFVSYFVRTGSGGYQLTSLVILWVFLLMQIREYLYSYFDCQFGFSPFFRVAPVHNILEIVSCRLL
jgi:hypothetical protein